MADILLVEDDPTSRYFMAALLSDMGYTVTSTASGDEALQFLYSEEPCDLVFADIVLPGMSGIELARRTARRAGPASLRSWSRAGPKDGRRPWRKARSPSQACEP
jgi:CheY-like chemotaxis protein